MIMKKTFLIAFLSVFVFPIAALASSITLAPTSVATVAGKTFSVTVGVNPTSGKAYTVRANLSFDPSAVTFTGFTFAPKWMALPQAGYDTEDNVGGSLVKTGGYPGGVTAPTTLGTATFRAKKTGATTIAGTADSLILDANNQNVATGNQSVQVTIAAASVTPPVTKPSSPAVTTTSTTTESATTTAGNEVPPQVAAVALSSFDSILTLGTGSAAVASLVTIVILLIIGAGIWLWRRP
jgi:hypothetical protein